MNAPATTVSKSTYAALKNVTPSRVSQWLAEGKIEPAALVGEGRKARINVHLADEHLRKNLDLSQRLGNGLSTRLPLVDPDTSPSDPIEDQLKREKLEGAQRENRKRAEEEAARAGRYIDAQAARSEMAKIAAKTMLIIEGALSEIASALAAKFSLPQRDVLHALRAEFGGVRTRAAATLREQAGLLPEFIEVELRELEPPLGASPMAPLLRGSGAAG